jgi:hypothetical protein
MTAAMRWTAEDFIADEKLLVPALQGHIYPNERLGAVLKHPFVCQVPFYSSKFANTQYEYKAAKVAELMKKRQFDHVLFIYERYSRLPVLYEWFREGFLRLPMLRKCLRFAWPDTEDPPYADALEMFMTAGYTSDTRKKLTGMLTLYRGDSCKRHNMEWSLQRSTAEWFARRYSCKTPWLAITQVDASNALAYFTCRGEAEVIIPPTVIEKVDYVKLKP